MGTTATAAAPTDTDQGVQQANAAAQAGNASAGGFDFGPIISGIINFLKSIFTGTGSFFSGLLNSNTPGAAPVQAAPIQAQAAPAQDPAINIANAQAQARAALNQPTTGQAGDPSSLPAHGRTAGNAR